MSKVINSSFLQKQMYDKITSEFNSPDIKINVNSPELKDSCWQSFVFIDGTNNVGKISEVLSDVEEQFMDSGISL